MNLRDRCSDLLVSEIGILREVVRAVRGERPFHIDAWVVLPEHMHCLWTLPVGDDDFPGRWQAIKIGFSRALPDVDRRNLSMVRKGELGIWQRRY